MYKFSRKNGIALTEEQWKWIDKENSEDGEEILDLLIAFCVIGWESEAISEVRNRLLESRELCLDLIKKFKDKELWEKVDGYVRNAD